MAQFGSVRPSSVDSNPPMSPLSSRSASSVSLASLSDSDYQSCVDEMPTEELPLDDFSVDNVDSEEFEIPLEAETGNQPSIVLIHSIATLPVPSPLPPLPFIFCLTVEQAIQSGEHDPSRPSGGATIVIWDPRLSGSFPPVSRTSILLPWWRSDTCLGTFGFPTYKQLDDTAAFGGRFLDRDPQSDDMEGMDVWDPTALEMLPERMRRVNLVRWRRIAVLTGEADTQFEAAAQAAEAAAAMAEAAELAEFSRRHHVAR